MADGPARDSLGTPCAKRTFSGFEIGRLNDEQMARPAENTYSTSYFQAASGPTMSEFS